MPSSRAAEQIAATSSCGNTTPPPRLWVFSTATSVVGGNMMCPGGLCAARRSEAVNNPPRPTTVNCTPEFERHPYVINGCSELFASVWGKDHGIGVRSAVGFASLPDNIPVEVEALFLLK